MPAFAKSSVGSSWGMTLEEGQKVCCFFFSKKSIKVWRTLFPHQSEEREGLAAILRRLWGRGDDDDENEETKRARGSGGIIKWRKTTMQKGMLTTPGCQK